MTTSYPYVPLLNQWTDTEEITAAKMFARVDTNFNLLRNAVLNPPRFKGSITTPAALTAATSIPFPVIYDTAAGWNASTHQYTVQVAGTYQISLQLKWTTSPGTVQAILRLNGSNIIISTAPVNAATSGPQMSTSYSFVAGAVIDVIVDVGFTTTNQGSADTNWWILTWTGV